MRLSYPAGSQQDRDHIEECLYFSVLILCHALPCSWESLEVHGDIFLQQVMKYTVLSICKKKKGQESIYKKLKLPCVVDQRQESCLGEGKNSLLPDV